MTQGQGDLRRREPAISILDEGNHGLRIAVQALDVVAREGGRSTREQLCASALDTKRRDQREAAPSIRLVGLHDRICIRIAEPPPSVVTPLVPSGDS